MILASDVAADVLGTALPSSLPAWLDAGPSCTSALLAHHQFSVILPLIMTRPGLQPDPRPDAIQLDLMHYSHLKPYMSHTPLL